MARWQAPTDPPVCRVEILISRVEKCELRLTGLPLRLTGTGPGIDCAGSRLRVKQTESAESH